MPGSRANRKRTYEKAEVSKWMADLRRFLIEDGSPKSFATFKYLKVVPSLLKDDLPTHSRSSSYCDDLPEATGYVVCENCRSLFVSSGGHLPRHVEDCYRDSAMPAAKITKLEVNANTRMNTLDGHVLRRYTQRQSEEISNAVAAFCLKAAVSFNMLGDMPFKDLIASVVNISAPGFTVGTVKDQLPSRQSVRRRVESVAADAISRVHQELRDLLKINKGFCGLVADHGKVIDDHLSLNVVLIDDRRGKWELKCYPLAFRKSGGKSADEVRKDFDKVFAELSIDMDLDRALLVADGAMRTVSASNYMLGYLRCVNHSINLLCKHTLVPYDADKGSFNAEELTKLEEINDLVKCCVSICNLVHFDKKLSDVLSRKPRKAVVTRWLTEFSSVCDVLDILDELFSVTSQNKKSAITPLVEKVMCNRSILRALQLVLWHMAACNKKFQERTILLHTVCYVYKKLDNLFEDYASGQFKLLPEEFEENWQYDDDAAKLMGKAAKLSLTRLYAEFGRFHLAAARLDYSKKDMKLFTTEEKKKADYCLMDLMEMVDLTNDPTPALVKERPASQSLFSDDSDVESTSGQQESSHNELLRYSSYKWKIPNKGSVDVSDFWLSHRHEFPRLYEVAKFLLGTTPSEAEAERNFSISSRIVTDKRKLLNHTTVEWLVLSSQIAASFPSLLTFANDPAV